MKRTPWLVLFALACAPRSPALPPTSPPSEPSVRIEDRAVTIRVAGQETSLHASAIGRGGAMRALEDGDPRVVGRQIRAERGGGIVEWWRSEVHGIEHGLDLAARPAGEGELGIDVDVDGDLSPRGEGVIALCDGSRTALLYAGLVVRDADGRELPSRMSADGTAIHFAIDDAGARYPLVIDPLIATEEALLARTAVLFDDHLGLAVAIDDVGAVAAVGAPDVDNGSTQDVGIVELFTRTGTTWTQLAPGLVPADRDPGGRYGADVDLDDTGTVLVVGMPGDSRGSGDRGSARLLRNAGGWGEEAVFARDTADAIMGVGGAVAISGDARRVAVAATGGSPGLAYVFRLDASTWTREARLVISTGTTSHRDLDLDRTGTRLIVSHDGAAAAEVWARTGTTWAREAMLTPTDLYDVSRAVLAADGASAAVAFRSRRPGVVGDVAVFVRAGTMWTEAATLTAGTDSLGPGIGISDDGTRIVAAHRASNGARLFTRTGTTWSLALPLSPSGVSTADMESVEDAALTAVGDRVVLGVPEDWVGTERAAGSARVFSVLRSQGDACAADGDCATGACADGICCNVDCGGTTLTDCQACAAGLTGLADGVCGALSATVAATVVCHASAGVCDVAEVCASTSTTCPADARASGTVCRAAAGACDLPELCDGSSIACPGDALAASDTPCRASAGSCDIVEVCTGSSPTCPGDTFASSGTVCGTGLEDCALPDTCTGSSASCPSAGVRPAGATCRPAAGACDVPDTCDGTSRECANVFASAGTACGASAGDVCDAPDVCSGSAASCPDVLLTGVECRPSAGTCDVPESCNGTATGCPPDVHVSAGIACRVASDPICDPEEVCDGTSRACPADVTTCTTIDGGRADGGAAAVDSGPAIDGGGAPPVAAGCGCRAMGGATRGAGWLALALVALLLRGRRSA